MFSRNARSLLGLLVAAMLGLVLVAPTQAATGTWNGPNLTGTWDTTDTNWTGVAAGTPWAGQGNTAQFYTADNTANVSGAIFADVVQLYSSGNAVNVAGGATVTQSIGNAKLYIAGQSNSVTVSTPGNVGASIYSYYVYGSSASTWVGGDGSTNATGGPTYSYDSLTINNGAFFRSGGGSGTTNSYIGANGGSNGNSMIVRGTDGTTNRSTFSTNGQRLYVGGYGSYNTMTVDQGGQALLRVLHVGAGGSYNTLTVDGAAGDLYSYVSVTEDMFVGDYNGVYVGTNNTVTVSGGARLASASRGTNNEFSTIIGRETNSNNNSLTVTGAGSRWTDTKKPVMVGGAGTQIGRAHV